MGKARLLVVDDDDDFASMLKLKLELFGYEVTGTVSSADLVMSSITETHPDVILLDIKLGSGCDGIDIANTIRNICNCAIIYVTGYSEDHLIERAKITEPLGYIIKPFSDTELKTAVELAVYRAGMEEKLRLSEEKYRRIFEASPETIVFLDTDGIVRDINRISADIIGYSKEDIVGRHILEAPFFTPTGREIVAKNLSLLMEGIETPSYEVEFITKFGAHIFGLITAVILKNKPGEMLGVIAIVSDITEQKKSLEIMREAKEAADTANRAKSEFLANMSHEIRTPINGIVGMIDLMLDTELTSSQKEYGMLIKSNAESLRAIIVDLLDFSKIEAGRLKLEIAEFDFKSFIDDIAKTLTDKAQSKGVEFRCIIDPSCPASLMGDPLRLSQILMNLGENAIKFTPEGHVELRVKKEGEDERHCILHFSIIDTGIGIAPSRKELLFKSFSQIDPSSTRIYGGTGLGLSISKRLVEMMGGIIDVVSEEGKGSTFWFVVNFDKPVQVI